MEEPVLRRTWAEIDLDALAHNYQQARRRIGPHVKYLGVVKADAYGHGAIQIARKLEKIARDIEYTIINGVYQKETDAGTAKKTRGLIELCSGSGNTKIDGKSAALTKALMQQLFKAMYDAGAIFSNTVLYVGSTQKQIITDIYSYAPTDRNVGGTNIKQIETDFGNIGIVLDRFMPQTAVLAAELSVLAPVFQPVPEKGNFFYEELAKTGASEEGQIFGQFGLDHGPAFMHGVITGLKG